MNARKCIEEENTVVVPFRMCRRRRENMWRIECALIAPEDNNFVIVVPEIPRVQPD